MASQLLCSASCYERIATSDANADLKQPLIAVQDLESSQSSFSSQEEQNADFARQRVRSLILGKSFCFGAFASLLLHAITFSVFWVMCKKLGKNPHPDESTPLSLWTIYLPLTIYIAFHMLVWVGFAMALSRKGSTYMLKKFDKEDASAPKSESVWTPRLLFLNRVALLIGISSGFHGAWVIFDIALGVPMPFAQLLVSLAMDVGLCCLMIKIYDWGHRELLLCTSDDEPEEDQEEGNSFFVV